MSKNIMRYTKIVCALALALILAIAAFGCENYEADDGILEEGYVPNPSGKIKLQYYIASTESSKRSCNDWVAAFQKAYPNVTVEAEINSRGKSAIQAEIAAKSVGDVFFAWETDVYNYAVEQKVLMPLDYYAEAYDIDTSNVFSAIYNMGVAEGKLYMVMRDYNHIALIYNKDLIAENNLEDPVTLERNNEWTWDTFKTYCAALTTQEDGTSTPTVGASLRLGYAPNYCAYLEGWGGSWYDTEEKKVTFIDDEKVLQAVNEIVAFFETNTCKYSATAGTGINPSASMRNFSGYEACFCDSEFPNFASIGKSYDSRGVDWDCVSYPAYPTHKVGTGATGFVVFNGTKNRDAAAALCLSLYTEDGQKAYNGQEGGSVPNVKSLADADFWRVPWDDRDDETLTDEEKAEAKNYYAWVSFPEADTYGQVECVVPPDIAEIVIKYMNNVIPNAINGTMTVDNTLNKLQTEANEKWASLK